MLFKRRDYFLQIKNSALLGPPKVFNGDVGTTLCEGKVAMRKAVTPVPDQCKLPHVVTDRALDCLVDWIADSEFAAESR